MIKARYSTEVLFQNGRIRRSAPIGLKDASDEQRQAIDLIKPVMNTWLRSKIEGNENVQVLVKSKYIETAHGLTIDFKIQAVEPIE